MTLNCLGRAVRYPLATGHPSGWPGGFSKVCPGGSTFGISFLFSFRFTGPSGLSSAFGASWSCGLKEAVDPPSEEISRRIRSHSVIPGM